MSPHAREIAYTPRPGGGLYVSWTDAGGWAQQRTFPSFRAAREWVKRELLPEPRSQDAAQ